MPTYSPVEEDDDLGVGGGLVFSAGAVRCETPGPGLRLGGVVAGLDARGTDAVAGRA
ncbi:MAG TPA: hypothetical protein VI669_11825 [Vicinamibacteria bacterium]